MTGTLGLTLTPLDVLFFRDGRPMGAGLRGQSGLPMPQHLAGALRSALLDRYGCDFKALGKKMKKTGDFRQAVQAGGSPEWIAGLRFRGPWLAQRKGNGVITVFVPTPATLHKPKKHDKQFDQLHSLKPLPAGTTLPGFISLPDGLRPLWRASDIPTEPAGGFITLDGLSNFLRGEAVDVASQWRSADVLYGFERRTGIGIGVSSYATEEGQIYETSLLALRDGVCFYGEMTLPAGAPESCFNGSAVIPFGGEGRRVVVERLPCPVDWPRAAPTDDRHNALIVLTQPAFFAQGWRPDCLNSGLAAAAVPGSLPVSGWDLARGGPKPARFATVAGSTYFLDTATANLPESLVDFEEDACLGYGSYVQGAWKDD